MWPLALILSVLVIVAFSVFWTHFRGAPWVPTPMQTVHTMLTLAEVGPGDVVYDLGCGDGRLVITAARRYGARAVGIEIDPLRYSWCRMLVAVLGLGDRVQIRYGDFFEQDLGAADVVTCYLLQGTNDKLEEKFKRELDSGTRVVSHTFTFSSLHEVRQQGDARLYIFYPQQA